MQQQFTRTDQDGLEEYRIGNTQNSWIKAPTYIPEIAGAEDTLAIIQNLGALDPNNPVIVPGHRWEAFRTKPEFVDWQSELTNLVSNYPMLYFEPPELFRYKMPSKLVTYALKGSISMRKKFNSAIRDGDVYEAIEQLPPFFQPFVERNLEKLCRSVVDDGEPIPEEARDSNGKAGDAWFESRTLTGARDHFLSLIEDAAKFPNSYLIPPVPPIMESSDIRDIRAVNGVNKEMMNLCETLRDNPSSSGDRLNPSRPVYPYYHIYIDRGAFKSSCNVANDLLNFIESELSDLSYAGVALTVSNLSTIWSTGSNRKFEMFVTSLNNIASQNDIPVVAPRSKWYGAYLTDIGVHAFSSMLNSSDKYSSGGGAPEQDKHRYGKVPNIEDATEIDIVDIDRVIEQNDELANIDGLPSTPGQTSASQLGRNPSLDELRTKYGSSREYRISFGKPRWLGYADAARQFRNGRKSGLLNPAKRHLQDSEHPHLSSG